jgi:pimeloyl-ACP methyl ester carboxylesterase
MDIAGLGDSVRIDGSPRAALYADASIADVHEAVDFLEARGLRDVALVGHCSGAWLALNSAVQDARVRRLFLVNLQRFIWTGEENLEALMARAYRSTDSYLQEIGSGAIWRRLLRGEVNWPRLPGIAAAIVRRFAARVSGRVAPLVAKALGVETETARITQMLTRLSARDAKTLLVYSDTDPGREELARHFGPGGVRLRLPAIDIDTIDNADHDITSESARRAYLDLLLGFLDAGEVTDASPEIRVAKAGVAEAA